MGDALDFGADFKLFVDVDAQTLEVACLPYLKLNLPTSFELLMWAWDCALS